MSVAFRRESDEEHKEPRFELPIPAGPNLVTARGRALIDERIAELEAGLSDADAEASEAIRRDLRYWKTRRATALPTAAPTGGTIGFGSVVQIKMNGKPRRIAIVGDDEADPKAGSIAFTAPLARALLGAEAGDILPFGGREHAIEVVAVG
ncbi:GreA/GreB family elongation factor [Sphingomonas sp.]|jgi:transcription elongation GreA/GreB family factor|uniref:GreA/GreB family elongation factor n=1 Tax=Sphingomonas sp. TaxID=28214 RepID=UPI002EDA21D0